MPSNIQVFESDAVAQGYLVTLENITAAGSTSRKVYVKTAADIASEKIVSVNVTGGGMTALATASIPHYSVKTATPIITSATPALGAVNIDRASLNQLSVTFSDAMYNVTTDATTPTDTKFFSYLQPTTGTNVDISGA